MIVRLLDALSGRHLWSLPHPALWRSCFCLIGAKHACISPRSCSVEILPQCKPLTSCLSDAVSSSVKLNTGNMNHEDLLLFPCAHTSTFIQIQLYFPIRRSNCGIASSATLPSISLTRIAVLHNPQNGIAAAEAILCGSIELRMCQ